MEYYESKYTGAEVDALLDKVKDVGGADWNAQEGEKGYIKNRTHYTTSVSIGTTSYTFIENIPKWYDSDSEIYYSSEEIHVQYSEDSYVGIIKIPMNTPLGYDMENTRFSVIGEDQGEEFTFSSYSDMGDIYFKVENPNAGTDFKVLFYTPLKDSYLPNTVLKTTPQSLSESAKNQALANLGIPRVLNINIYGIEDNLTIDELSEILGDCVTNEILILGLCYRSKYSTVYLPTLHQSYTDFDGRKILNKLVCGQYRVDEDSYDFHLVVCPSVYLYYDEDTQNYRYFLEEY